MKTAVALFVSLSIFSSYVPEEEQKSRGEVVYFVNAVVRVEDGKSFKLQMIRLSPDQANKKADWLKKAEEERERLQKEFGDSELEENEVRPGPFWTPDFWDHRKELDRFLAEAAAITGPRVVAEIPACDMPENLMCFSFLVKLKVERELVGAYPSGIQVWRHNFWRWRVVYP